MVVRFRPGRQRCRLLWRCRRHREEACCVCWRRCATYTRGLSQDTTVRRLTLVLIGGSVRIRSEEILAQVRSNTRSLRRFLNWLILFSSLFDKVEASHLRLQYYLHRYRTTPGSVCSLSSIFQQPPSSFSSLSVFNRL